MTVDPADRLTGLASRYFTAMLLAIAALAVTLAILGRAGQDFSNDEPFTALMLEKSAAELPGVFVDDNIPLWYVLLRPWRAILGDSEWALRSLSLACYALAVIVTGVAGRRLGGAVTGLMAAWLLATSARIGLRFAATARPYALLCALASAAIAGHLLLFEDLRRTRRHARLLGAGLLAVHLAGLFTQPLYAFFAAACAVGSLIFSPDRRGLALAALPLAAIGLYAAFWSSTLTATFLLPTTSWMTRAGLTDLMAGFLALWGWRNGWVLVGAILTLLLVRRGAWSEVSTRGWRFCLTVTVLAIAGIFVASSFSKPIYSAASTTIVVLPAVALAIASALVRLGSPRLTAVLALLVLSSAVAYAVEGITSPDPAPSQASIAAVSREIQCGDRVVAAGVSFAPVTWYARRNGFPSCLSIEAFPQEVSRHPGWFEASATAFRRPEFLAEAAALASSLPAAGRLWVFAAERGAGAEVTQLLDDVPALVLERRLPLAGTYFDHVRVYRRKM